MNIAVKNHAVDRFRERVGPRLRRLPQDREVLRAQIRSAVAAGRTVGGYYRLCRFRDGDGHYVEFWVALKRGKGCVTVATITLDRPRALDSPPSQGGAPSLYDGKVTSKETDAREKYEVVVKHVDGKPHVTCRHLPRGRSQWEQMPLSMVLSRLQEADRTAVEPCGCGAAPDCIYCGGRG